MEIQSVFERQRNVHAEQTLRRSRTHIHHAQSKCQRIADAQSQDDGTHPQVLIPASVEQQDADKNDCRHTDILPAPERPVIHRRIASAARYDTYFYQAQAYHQDDDARHQGRNDRTHILEHPAHYHLDRCRRHTRPEHQRKPTYQSGSDYRSDKRKARPLDTEQARAYRPYRPALDKSRYAGGKQSHRHQETRRLQIQLQRTGYNQRRRNDGDEDSQEMLQGGKQCILERRAIVDAIYQIGGLFFLLRSHSLLF